MQSGEKYLFDSCAWLARQTGFSGLHNVIREMFNRQLSAFQEVRLSHFVHKEGSKLIFQHLKETFKKMQLKVNYP